jgi:hypothetical protein
MSSPVRCWAPSFSPLASFGQVPVPKVRAATCQHFRRWGRPKALRVDNGTPWGNFNDLPTPFALWMAGLGIQMFFNDPCRPQQNPKIERSQGTGKRWAEPKRCLTPQELQANLDEADRDQREFYPAIDGLSRLVIFPSLRHSGRSYSDAWEKRTWSLQWVQTHLAEFVAIRKVSSSGHIGIYDHCRFVGTQYKGSYVQVQYDPDRQQWLISDEEGRELRRHLAPEISQAEIYKAKFRKPRKKL